MWVRTGRGREACTCCRAGSPWPLALPAHSRTASCLLTPCLLRKCRLVPSLKQTNTQSGETSLLNAVCANICFKVLLIVPIPNNHIFLKVHIRQLSVFQLSLGQQGFCHHGGRAQLPHTQPLQPSLWVSYWFCFSLDNHCKCLSLNCASPAFPGSKTSESPSKHVARETEALSGRAADSASAFRGQRRAAHGPPPARAPHAGPKAPPRARAPCPGPQPPPRAGVPCPGSQAPPRAQAPRLGLQHLLPDWAPRPGPWALVPTKSRVAMSWAPVPTKSPGVMSLAPAPAEGWGSPAQPTLKPPLG